MELHSDILQKSIAQGFPLVYLYEQVIVEETIEKLIHICYVGIKSGRTLQNQIEFS